MKKYVSERLKKLSYEVADHKRDSIELQQKIQETNNSIVRKTGAIKELTKLHKALNS